MFLNQLPQLTLKHSQAVGELTNPMRVELVSSQHLLVVRTGPGLGHPGLSLRVLNRYLPRRTESHVVSMKFFLTLFAVFGILAFTPTPVQSEQKTSENNTFNSFWSGASQASAGVICHAYKKGMIEMDQALDLIFNEYLVAYNVEIDTWTPSINWQGQSLGSSFVASFGEALDRAGCESLNAPNYLFAPEKGSNAVIKSVKKPVKKRAKGI